MFSSCSMWFVKLGALHVVKLKLNSHTPGVLDNVSSMEAEAAEKYVWNETRISALITSPEAYGGMDPHCPPRGGGDEGGGSLWNLSGGGGGGGDDRDRGMVNETTVASDRIHCIVTVENLPVVPKAKETKLRGVLNKIFGQMGEVTLLEMPFDEKGSSSLGACCVVFRSPEMAAKAVMRFNGRVCLFRHPPHASGARHRCGAAGPCLPCPLAPLSPLRWHAYIQAASQGEAARREEEEC